MKIIIKMKKLINLCSNECNIWFFFLGYENSWGLEDLHIGCLHLKYEEILVEL